MKYLKKYKLFESMYDDSVIEDIKDILLELNHDHKMSCMVYSNFKGIAENYILVEIYKPSEDHKLIIDRFHIGEVTPVIERIELYLTQIGLEYDTEYDSDVDDNGKDGLDWPKHLFIKFKIKNNNIDEYRLFVSNYEKINEKANEKIKWTNYLLLIGLSFIIMNNIRNFNDVRTTYNAINSEKSIPSEKDQSIIDSIRQDVIDIVILNDKFKKFGKQSIIDSLRLIKILTPDKLAGGRGIFINLDKKINIFSLFNKTSDNNFILIEKSVLNNPDSAYIVSHELYHYLNKLYDDNDIEIIQPVLDKNIEDKSYGCGKLAALLGKNYNKLDEDKKKVIDNMYHYIMTEKKYYMSDVEMFARWLTLKQMLLNYGIIKDINQKVKLIDIVRDINIKDNYNIEDDIIVVFCLDLKKMGEIEL